MIIIIGRLVIIRKSALANREQKAFEVGLKAGSALGKYEAYMEFWADFRNTIPPEIAEQARQLIEDIGL